jgi:hypothetical protein
MYAPGTHVQHVGVLLPLAFSESHSVLIFVLLIVCVSGDRARVAPMLCACMCEHPMQCKLATMVTSAAVMHKHATFGIPGMLLWMPPHITRDVVCHCQSATAELLLLHPPSQVRPKSSTTGSCARVGRGVYLL